MIVPVWCVQCRGLVYRVIGVLPDVPGSWAVRYPGGPDEPVVPVRCVDHPGCTVIQSSRPGEQVLPIVRRAIQP